MKDSMPLDAAIRALRDQLFHGEPAATRRRILTTLAEKQKRRRRSIQALLFVGTFLCGATAAAWFTGDLPRLMTRIIAAYSGRAPEPEALLLDSKNQNTTKEAVEEPTDVTSAKQKGETRSDREEPKTDSENQTSEDTIQQSNDTARVRGGPAQIHIEGKRTPSSVEKTADSISEAKHGVTENAAIGGGTQKVQRARDAGVAPAPKPTESRNESEDRLDAANVAPPLTPYREQALYQDAHRKHFRGNDAEAAVKAWDTYLKHAPRGKLHLEARYNRAIALVRAGRLREAARALEPFAYGEHGDYRRKEAGRLLSRIHTRLVQDR